jgi:hypothetical protein
MPDNEEVKNTTGSDDDELITPENIDTIDDEPADDEKETPAASSAEDKPDDDKTKEESDESEEASEEEPEESEEKIVVESEKDKSVVTTTEKVEKQPKEVPGETPREKALRLEASRVKKLLRQERGKKLIGDIQPQEVVSTKLSESEEDRKVLGAFDPEQVENQRKLFSIFAKQQGYVKKDEFSKQTFIDTAQSVLDDFLEKHEEYSAEKDPDGILWNRFKQEYGMYAKPANPKDFVKIFNRVHNEIFGITTTPKQTLAKTVAQKEKISVASAGSSASKPTRLSDKQRPTPNTSELSKVARGGGLKGFSEEELAEMGL